MPKYECPSGDCRYPCKFIRVGDQILVTSPDDTDTSHDAFVREEGVEEEIKRLRSEDPMEVDGGQLFVASRDLGKDIYVVRSAFTVGLPVIEEARDKTITVLGLQSPGFRVHKDEGEVTVFPLK